MFSHPRYILQLCDSHRDYIFPSPSPIPSLSLSDKAIIRCQSPFLWKRRQHTKWNLFLPVFFLPYHKPIANVPFCNGSNSFSNFCCKRGLVCAHVDASQPAVEHGWEQSSLVQHRRCTRGKVSQSSATVCCIFSLSEKPLG